MNYKQEFYKHITKACLLHDEIFVCEDGNVYAMELQASDRRNEDKKRNRPVTRYVMCTKSNFPHNDIEFESMLLEAEIARMKTFDGEPKKVVITKKEISNDDIDALFNIGLESDSKGAKKGRPTKSIMSTDDAKE